MCHAQGMNTLQPSNPSSLSHPTFSNIYNSNSFLKATSNHNNISNVVLDYKPTQKAKQYVKQ
jgi:hypothetical protein